MNGYQPAKNLDANGSERKPEQTVKSVKGRGSANANKERECPDRERNHQLHLMTRTATTQRTCIPTTTIRITTITMSFITIIHCRHPHHPCIITANQGTVATVILAPGEWRETWSTVDRGQISAPWSTSHLSFLPVVTSERGRGSVNVTGNASLAII